MVKRLRWSGTHNMDIPHGCTVPLRWIIEESNAARAMSTRDSRCFFELHVLALQRETEVEIETLLQLNLWDLGLVWF